MTFGQKLKKLRIEKNLTQKDLADQLHVTFQTVSKWENDTNEPDFSTLKEISKILGCSIEELFSESDSVEEPTAAEVAPAPTQTIVIHQKELHVCRRCNKDIPEDQLAVEHLTRSERFGRTHRTVPAGEAYYHKDCLEQVNRERQETARREKEAHASRAKKLSFGWGIAGGVVALTITLVSMLIAGKEVIHPALAVLYSILIGYGIFAMLYCIISGSYIGEVFIWCASLSIKFPGLIFTWDLGGIIWLIWMKFLFAVLGFLIGVLALLFAIGLSALLGGVSFPFVLIHNIRTDYEDAL